MKKLLKIALGNRSYRTLIGLIITAMCLLTLASQLEIFSLGVITKKGPDFFELFADNKDNNNQLKKVGRNLIVEKTVLEKRWQEIDLNDKGYITDDDVIEYQATRKHHDFIEQMIAKLNTIFPISGNFRNLAFFLVFVALFKATMLFIHRYTTRIVAIRISRDLRQQYFEHIQSLPMDFYQKHNMGSLSSRVVGDAVLVAEAINACLVNYLQTPFTVISTLALCFMTSWQLSLITFFGLPFVLFPIIFLAKRVKRISKQIQQNQERFAAVLIDFLNGIQTVKIFAMEEFSLKKYREQNQRMAVLEQKSARYDLLSRPVVHTIGMFFLATSLLYGLYIVNMSVSEVLFYCGLLYVFYEPIKKFAEENSHIQRGISAAERMFEVMDLKPHIQDHDGATCLKTLVDKIEFENVWFSYGEKWVIKNLSFVVRKGETVAIVGPTGSGKSTIVQLLPRLYDIQEGEIRIDGKSIKTYTQKSLRENIAFVPQKPFLFLDTIGENIAFGNSFTQAQIEEAARKAYAEEFILQQSKGYDTELSESGKSLSGGQQQRLAIARALVKDASILIMDEATSALDSVSENHIKHAIRDLHGKVTQIIIAHRLSTIEDADRIIYLEKGEKIAEGTKDELLETCLPFKKMWDMRHHSAGHHSKGQ